HRPRLRARRQGAAPADRPRQRGGPGRPRPRALPQLLPRRRPHGPHPHPRPRARRTGRRPAAGAGDAQRPRRRAGGDQRRPARLSLHPRRQRAARVGGALRGQRAALRHLHRLQGRPGPRGDALAVSSLAMNERWSLAAGHVPDLLLVGLLAGAVLLALVEGLRAFRRPRSGVSRRLSAGLLALRLGALAALLAVAFELTLRIEEVTASGRRLVVLVDRSARMALPDAPGDD